MSVKSLEDMYGFLAAHPLVSNSALDAHLAPLARDVGSWVGLRPLPFNKILLTCRYYMKG